MGAVNYGVPAEESVHATSVETFEGVNFTDTLGNIDERKSPDAPNMIRDVPGKVRKCMGYHLVKTFTDEDGNPLRINGYHERRGDDVGLIHAGTKLYKGDALLFDGMADARSRSWQMEQKLFLMDGKALLVYDGETVKTAESIGYIPTLTIAKDPAGGGTDYEALNLLQPKYTELFQGTDGGKTFQMSFSEIDTDENGTPIAEAWVLNENGDWVQKTYGTDFSANASTGVITFVSAPGQSPVTGEDNVKITVARTVAGYADRVNHCNTGILFGVSGNADRLFITGNSDTVDGMEAGNTVCYRNYDWYSGQNDPTYWPDTAYSTVGASQSAIVAYSIVNNYLATIKDDAEPERNIVIREGDLVNDLPAFPVVNTMQGPGAIAPFSMAYLSTEPLFLTKLGIYAVTTSDISGEKYSQNRSYYLDGKLRGEKNMAEAFGFVHNDLYWLCLNGVAYILDGLQPIRTDRSAPYSTRQYAGFYRTNLPARVMWETDDGFFFGTPAGQVMQFYDDPEDPVSYNDNGAPIEAWWTTPYLFGGNFSLNKIFRNLAVLLSAMPVTSITLEMLNAGQWQWIATENEKTRFFDWLYFQWSKFTWAGDPTPRTVLVKAKLKKVDKVQYRFSNKELNEGFGILQFACEYTLGSHYKG